MKNQSGKILKNNPYLRRSFLLALSGLMITQSAVADLSEVTTRYQNVDRLEILIKHLESQPLTESEKFILQDIDSVLQTQIADKPSREETHLTLKEKFLLSKVVAVVLFRGLNSVFSKINPESVVGISESRLKDLSEKDLTEGEESILKLFASMINRDALVPYLEHKLKMVSRIPVIGKGFKKNPEKGKLVVQFAASNIQGLVKTRGLTKDSKKVIYEPWTSIVERQTKAIQQHQVPRYNAVGMGVASQFSFLVDGSQSFAKRAEILNRAKNNIDILVWAIQDDITGQWTKDLLLKKHKEGVKVRIILDGDVSKRPKYGARVRELQAEGIEVIRWTHPEFQYVGQHRKMIIVDGTEMIAGGLNFGDHYSHMNPEASFWRDTDIYASGDFVTRVALPFFDKVWNQSASRFGMNRIGLRSVRSEPLKAASSGKGVAIELLDHSPQDSQGQDSNIYNSILADIMTAKKSVDIANAYVIVTDAFIEAVRQAVGRGVRVRVLTNSNQSVDEPTLGGAMMISAKKLKAVGADVYLRKGTTLHSKFMAVDGRRAHVMSYNLHPRSERMEGEVSFIINDESQTRILERIFEKDISDPLTSTRVASENDIELKDDVLTWLLIRIMYDQL